MIKKNNLFEMGIIIAMLVFSLLLFGIYLIFDLFSSKKDYILFLNPYTILKCEKWNCENVSDDLLKYNNKSYNIYFNNSYVGKKDLYYDQNEKKYYVFNEQNKNIYNYERLLAFSGRASIKSINFNEEEISASDLEFIRDKFNDSLDYSNVSKIVLDFDDDSKIETLYLINKENSFRAVAYLDNGRFKVLDEINYKEVKDVYDIGTGYVSNVLDILDDNKLEFIYTITYFDDIGSCNIIYRLDGKKFIKVNECEIVR